MCGHLLWPAMVSQPDILFATVHLAQFVKDLSEAHWRAVKQVMKYLHTTRDYTLMLGSNTRTLHGYTDSDWATQNHRHSISRYAFFLGIRCITWSSKKQPIIVLSSAEAEYITGTHATKEGKWLCMLLTEFNASYNETFTINCDNQSAITITCDNKFHA